MTTTMGAAAAADPTWTTWRQALILVRARRSVTKSGLIATVVGSVFFAMNQFGPVLAGQATTVLWLKAALTYLTPFVVSNIGMLSATRRPFNAVTEREA